MYYGYTVTMNSKEVCITYTHLYIYIYTLLYLYLIYQRQLLHTFKEFFSPVEKFIL